MHVSRSNRSANSLRSVRLVFNAATIIIVRFVAAADTRSRRAWLISLHKRSLSVVALMPELGRSLPVAMACGLHDGCVPDAARQLFAAAKRTQTRRTARRMAAVMPCRVCQ
jgi:hypothetical protein